MNITYRRATKADIEVINALLFLLYNDEEQAPELTQEELFEENEELFADKNTAFFLAVADEKPIAVSHGALRREYVNGTNDDLKGYLEAIYVLPEYRKHGIAAKLVQISERWMQMNGCTEAASDCLIENTDSYNFHLKIGFEETERCIFFLKALDPLKYKIVAIDSALREKVQPILDESWNAPYIVINGKLWDTRTMPGFAAICDGDLLGYLLYELQENVCEIMVLESLAQNIGIASALIEQVKQITKTANIDRISVTTTNDNTHAIRFYQRRGFSIREIRLEAVAAARKLKPSIPLVGMDGIPIRDEVELEIKVGDEPVALLR